MRVLGRNTTSTISARGFRLAGLEDIAPLVASVLNAWISAIFGTKRAATRRA
jgi:hypothetical protein